MPRRQGGWKGCLCAVSHLAHLPTQVGIWKSVFFLLQVQRQWRVWSMQCRQNQGPYAPRGESMKQRGWRPSHSVETGLTALLGGEENGVSGAPGVWFEQHQSYVYSHGAGLWRGPGGMSSL